MGKRIYVLEDDRDIREVIEMVLREEQYEVFTFSTVKDFFDRKKESTTDLFLLDVMLPDGNGIEVCEMLKAEGATRDIPVLMMGANTSQSQIDRCCQANGFVPKPFDITELLGKVNQTLNN